MRIIAGSAKGVEIHCPPGLDVRPVPETCRQAIFSILADRIANCRALDIFAGAGSVGLEALSRGATECVFIEKSPRARKFINRNLAACRLEDRAKVLPCDALNCVGPLRKLGKKFDFVFCGPPFPLWDDPVVRTQILAMLDRLAGAGLAAADAVIVIQSDMHQKLPPQTAHLEQTDAREYGRNLFSFYRLRRNARKAPLSES